MRRRRLKSRVIAQAFLSNHLSCPQVSLFSTMSKPVTYDPSQILLKSPLPSAPEFSRISFLLPPKVAPIKSLTTTLILSAPILYSRMCTSHRDAVWNRSTLQIEYTLGYKLDCYDKSCSDSRWSCLSSHCTEEMR